MANNDAALTLRANELLEPTIAGMAAPNAVHFRPAVEGYGGLHRGENGRGQCLFFGGHTDGSIDFAVSVAEEQNRDDCIALLHAAGLRDARRGVPREQGNGPGKVQFSVPDLGALQAALRRVEVRWILALPWFKPAERRVILSRLKMRKLQAN